MSFGPDVETADNSVSRWISKPGYGNIDLSEGAIRGHGGGSAPIGIMRDFWSMDAMTDSLSVFQLISRDIDSYAEASAAFQGRKAGLLRRISILVTPSLACCVLIRLAHAAHLRGWKGLARALARFNALVHHAEIDPAASIGPGLYIPHPPSIVIRARAGCRLTVYSCAILGPLLPLPLAGDTLASCPVLGDDVKVGAGAIVAGPISVGSGVQIGAAAVVLTSTPAGSTLMAIGSMGSIARG